MVGIGTGNIAAGVFQGFAVSTSGSRTAVAEQSGAKSQLTGLIGAAVVVVLLVVFPAVLADLPQPALAAVVIAAALSLADLTALTRYWRVRTSALLLSLAAGCRRHLLRRARRDRRRRRPIDPDVRPAQLVAPRRGPRPGSGRRKVAQPGDAPRRHSAT
jgi:hypothetical protein